MESVKTKNWTLEISEAFGITSAVVRTGDCSVDIAMIQEYDGDNVTSLTEESIAHAHLIVTAPELLEQLEKSVAILGAIMDKLEVTPPEKCQKDFIEMVETIKKARGEV